MPVTDVRKDPDALTMTIVAELAAPAARVWELWADPRRLERWWGPPAYPATYTRHELRHGGQVRYHMVGPGGDRYNGWWRVLTVEPPRRLVFEDGFADRDGNPAEGVPFSIATVTLTEHDGRTTMEIHSQYPSAEAMNMDSWPVEGVGGGNLQMDAVAGLTAAIDQIDGLLADGGV